MIRVLVVDDSAYNRAIITRMLSRHPDIEVIDTARDGEDALKKIRSLQPDVITLDLEMPTMDGFGVLRWIQKNMPIPVVVVSARATDHNVFKALELGAVDFIAKPTKKASPSLQVMENDLITKVVASTKAKLKNIPPKEPDEESAKPSPVPKPSIYELIAMGASTGGPAAIQSIVSTLPYMPLPIVVAQHMPPVFTQLFSERLDRLTKMRVVEARDSQAIAPGTVYIAPGGGHLSVSRRDNRLYLNVLPRMSDDLYAPSVDILFRSVAKVCAGDVLGILLTGMGNDGASGLKAIQDSGGYTIVESEESAVVFGMPGEAIRLGAARKVLPLWEIPGEILKLSQKEERS